MQQKLLLLLHQHAVWTTVRGIQRAYNCPLPHVYVGEASWIPTVRAFSASISFFFTMLGVSTQPGAVEAASAGQGQNQQVPVGRLNCRNTCLLLRRSTQSQQFHERCFS